MQMMLLVQGSSPPFPMASNWYKQRASRRVVVCNNPFSQDRVWTRSTGRSRREETWEIGLVTFIKFWRKKIRDFLMILGL